MSDTNIYDPAFIAKLFDEMSGTYGAVNLISSFGFCVIWRGVCLRQLPLKPGMRVYDLMSGMGELWPGIHPRIAPGGQIHAVDISPVMCSRAEKTSARCRAAKVPVQVLRADVLENDLPDASADAISCSFGLKTFSLEQQRTLARQIFRLLKPGASFSFLEISVPGSAFLRIPYLFYLTHIIPILGWMFLGNPDNYRYLSRYTKAFGNVSHFSQALTDEGLTVKQFAHFFGCATGVTGSRPIRTEA